MVLDRNVDEFFAETEQVAFCPSHVVPGIDFTNDPLLQGRLFSYLDTQLSRLGGPNFHQIPVNKSACPVPNFHRGGHMQMDVPTGPAANEPNTLRRGSPRENAQIWLPIVCRCPKPAATPADAARVASRTTTRRLDCSSVR